MALTGRPAGEPDVRRLSRQELLARWFVQAYLRSDDTNAGRDRLQTVRASAEGEDGQVLVRTARGETFIVSISGPF